MDKKEAAQRMIFQELSAIPLSLIERAYPYIEGFDNVTPITSGSIVIYNGEEYEVVEVADDWIELEDGERVEEWEVDRDYEEALPMWGTVWIVNDEIFNRFIDRNPQAVAECGFKIYQAEDVDGYILGIDGAGYDFYEAHWIPLYDAQGLKWHDQ